MAKTEKISARGAEIAALASKESDYISLAGMAGYKEGLEARAAVSNRASARFTLEFPGIWEQI
jgi:hypothetical protein